MLGWHRVRYHGARAETYHGVFPHFLHSEAGPTFPFSEMDDGGDLVETAYLMVGLLCARQFFYGAAASEASPLESRVGRRSRAGN